MAKIRGFHAEILKERYRKILENKGAETKSSLERMRNTLEGLQNNVTNSTNTSRNSTVSGSGLRGDSNRGGR